MSNSVWVKFLCALCVLLVFNLGQRAQALGGSCGAGSQQAVMMEPDEFCGSSPPSRLSLARTDMSCCSDDVCRCESRICGGDSVGFQPLLLAKPSQPRIVAQKRERRLPSVPPARMTYPAEQSRAPRQHDPDPPERPPQSLFSSITHS